MIQLAGYTYGGPLGPPGNFGAVYHARNNLSGAEVAIKHIDEAMSANALTSWKAEATAMAACDHPNLVRIFHAEVTADGPAMVMEYLPDGSVGSRYGDGPAPVGEVVDILVDVCWGLHRLHSEFLTHRDIKPRNLLISGNTVKLGDFGLARTSGDPAALIYGVHTPPEVFGGGPWTEASDIFATGATGWRLLWGDDLCGRHDPDVNARARLGSWPDRGAWPLHVHKRLRTSLRACLHPDAGKRPGSASDLRSALERARPSVSWTPEPGRTWRGADDRSSWRVEVARRRSGFMVQTSRDAGKGFRQIGALCSAIDNEAEALEVAAGILQGTADGSVGS